MSDARSPVFPPVEIGTDVRPPTVVTPDLATMFARRARRFRELAPDHQLAPWLLFLGDLSEAQDAIQIGLPSPRLPDAGTIVRSIAGGMPVLPRTPFEVDPVVVETIERLLDRADRIAMPDPARAALQRLREVVDGKVPSLDAMAGRDPAISRGTVLEVTAASSPVMTLPGCIDAVLTDSIPVDAIAEHVFIGAALQVHFARAAALLDASRLNFIGDGVCPVCGAPPATSGIVGWGGADRTRFCTCSLCGTRWNAVRVKCLTCSSTKGIHYQSIKGLADTIKAECCDECRTFVKILAEDEDPSLEPIADDVASLGLDLLVLESGYRRAGVNLFLIGT